MGLIESLKIPALVPTHAHTTQGRGQQSGKPLCPSKRVSYSRRSPHPTPDREEENDRVDSIERNIQFLLLGGYA